MGKIKNQNDALDPNASSENSTNSRVMELIAAEGLSASAFADKIGVQRSSISHISNGRNEPSVPLIKKIMQAFPHVNVEWLLMGIGSIYKGASSPTPDNVVNTAVETSGLFGKPAEPVVESAPVNNVKSDTSYMSTSKPVAESKPVEKPVQDTPRRNTTTSVGDYQEVQRVDSVKTDGGFPGFMFNGGFVVLNPNSKTYSFYRPE